MNYQVHYTGKFYKGLTREMQSPSFDKKLTYEVGQTYDADNFEVSNDECGPGIHLVTSIALALKWGPVVVEMEVPDGAEIVWSAQKLRTSRVTVVGVANLSGADLRGADLSSTNLSDASLSGANLYRANLSGANLRVANLRGADLRGAYLSDANLYRADLSGADLSSTIGKPAYLPTGWKFENGRITQKES